MLQALPGRDELRRVHRQMVSGDDEATRWAETAAGLEAFDESSQATRREATRPVLRRYRLTPR